MNKIYKVMYSKVKQCCVVVSEIAKSHGRHTKRSVAKSSAALTAGVLIALGSFSFEGMPVVQAADGTESLKNNDYVGANGYYWYFDEKTNQWTKYPYKISSLNNNRSWQELPNYEGGGAKEPGAVTAGLYAQAGEQTVTIGNRNAGQSKGSVFIGELDGYNDGGKNDPVGMKNNYVTAVGFQSNATGWGSIAIGSNAVAENTRETSQVVDYDGNKGTSGTVQDDNYGIKLNPPITWSSVALGYNAHSKDGNIAIGANSDATSTDKGDSYVSVGNGTLKRRITNVAKGTDNSDVVTVGQMNDAIKQADNLNVNAGWGINVADENDPTNTGKETKNVISLKHNLGTGYNDDEAKGMIIGGLVEGRDPAKQYGAADANSVIVGAGKALASGKSSVVVGGLDNVASGATSVVIGGDNNNAAGNQSAVFGGRDNKAVGVASTASGGIMNAAVGQQATAIGGSNNYVLGANATAVGGLGRDYANGEVVYDSAIRGSSSVGIAGGSTGEKAMGALAAGHQSVVTTENGTAIGYQATTDEANTIAFGHDAGDVSGYTIKWKQLPPNQINADGTTNDYTQAPESVTENKYTTAAYNRLVKVADGQDDHDVVVMEQLNNAKNDLKVNAGWGINVNDVTTKNDDGTETTTKNVISLKRNLGKNYGSRYGTGKVNFEADGENSLILGGGALNDSWEDRDKEVTYGAHGKDSILVGGLNNDIAKDSEKVATSIGTRAVIIGGTSNTVSYDPVTEKDPDTGKEKVKVDSNGNVIVQTQKTGTDAIIVGGLQNTAKGDGSVLIGGERNEATGFYSTVIGGTSNKTDGWLSSIFGGTRNTITGDPTAAGIFGGTGNTINSNGIAANVFGGENNTADNTLAVVVGGEANTSSGPASIILGGNHNTANQLLATVVGGQLNTATGETSMISGGIGNVTSGAYSYDAGGLYNRVTGMAASSLGGLNSSVNGMLSTGVAGGSTGENAILSLAAGYQSVVTDSGVEKTYVTGDDAEKVLEDQYSGKELPGYYTRDQSVDYGPGEPGRLIHYDKFATALGYQATADEYGTIAFGHDAGDESGYTYEWETLTDENGNPKQNEIDGTTNDYTKAPKSVKKKAPYTSAYYNRLVKVADGIDDHDVVVMEQLKQYAEKDASNIGNNIKVYKTDANGNVQLDKDKKPIEETDATTTAQNGSKDDWGQALGAGTFTTGTSDKATDASTSDQLVTGKTLYDYDKPTGSQNYVNVKNTTGQNLSALDAQVKANADTLNDKTHNIKYYSVDENLPKIDGYTNEGNDGAKGMGSIAAGFNTHADGIASTVAGSYSGVINSKTDGLDLRGATALSYGTFNINQNTDATKEHSGVANSIIGQVNMTTNSNAAIIYGAGNTVTDSYRPIDKEKAKAILDSTSDPKALSKAMQDAVKDSGGQVMVMGGGNVVDNAYMSQVTGVGNTVKGNQVYAKNAKTGKLEWTTDTNKDTAIKDYDPEKSSQYNYVDGFSNEVINGKHDYVIGANNKLSGDSYDDKEAKKYSNESNIVFGDNHTLTNTKNAVIIGSSDTQMILDKGDNATAIGHNASAQRDALAVGVNTEARGNAVALGTSTIAHNNSIAIGTKATAVSSQNLAIGWEAHIGNIQTDDEKIKNAVALGSDSQVKVNDLLESDNNRGVLSIGDKDKERRIIHVRAGVNATDAVNVSQLESVQSDLTGKGLKFAANSGNEYTAKLGSTVTIQGTKKTEGHEYTADNLTTEIDEKGNITILMDKDMSVEKLAVNGKNGKDGAPGTPGSIGISGQDGQSSVGIDGKDGISIKGNVGKDGVTIKVDNGKDGKDGSEGHIGLTGRDGSSADIIVKKGYDDKDKGINGANGVDGKNGITRIVYTDAAGNHQVATMEDGLKFKGDDTTVINKKLNNTLDIIGGAKGDLTEGNIGVNSDGDKLKVQLSKDLTGMNSTTYTTTTGEGESATTSTTVVNGNGLTITDGPSITNKGIDGGNKVITNVGSGIETDANGKYTVTDQNKGNAANIGDVQNMVNEAVNSAADTTNKALAGKANVDASNIGANLKGEDGKTPATEAEKTKNENAWGSAIGTGKIEANNGQLVTGKTVYEYNKPVAEDGKTLNYVSEGKTTGQNLGALDAQVKNNADAIKKNSESIQNITNNVKNLSDNAVQYDKDSNKTKVTLGGDGGTTITNVKDGALNDSSTDAVNGKQLYAEQTARKELETKVTSNTTEINNIKDGQGFTDKGKEVIRDLAKGSVKVIAGTNTTVTPGTDEDGATTYAVNVEGNGKVASGDTNLISGGTLYNEVHVTTDGSYIKGSQTVGQNLSSLDSGLKTTSDLIHTNTAGDTIQIGGNSTATKIDVNGKDGKGRVITGVVVRDANDPTSAANVGYVNGVTAANTQQIYRDMNNAYGRLNNNINKAAAGSNALAALHPLDYDPDDKADFAVGYGHYRNANAAAVGAFYHPNENTMVNVGVSLGNGDPGFNAGVSFKVGRGGAGHEAMSKTEMAKVINSQSKEIDALKKDNADKDKRIDALEQKMAEILAKLDKNGK